MKKNNNGVNRLIPYLKKYKLKISTAVLLIVVSAFLAALSPAFEGRITTVLFADVTSGKAVDFEKITHIIIILACIYLGGNLSSYIYQLFLTEAIQSAMEDLRREVQAKISKLPISYFDKNSLGDTLSRVSNDVDTISNALQQSFAQVLNAILGLSLAVFMMLSINRGLTIISFIIIILSIIISRLITKKSQPIFEKQQNALGNLNAVVQEKFTGFNEIKLFGKQEDSMKEFAQANEELCREGFRAQFISGLMTPLVSFITYIGIGVTAILGSFYVITGAIAVGQLQAFIRYIWQVNQPMSQITQLAGAIQSSIAAVHRVFDFLNQEEEIESAIGRVEAGSGKVTFEKVSFSYSKDKALLNNVNFEVKSGQMVAIVGPTGAGKTTLINLLMRFYEVNEGSIRIDGMDIRQMKREDLREKFGMVLQDTWLFNGSIKANIAYGREGASEEEVIRAAKVANVHHFITTLPEGYDMVLNEEANNVSQGEKQLMTIARTVLCDPPILILDEATSSVDTRLEQKFQTAMRNLMKDRTSFVIAHRLSTIKNADLILVMKDGGIVEQGTHDELLEQKGHYAQLYNAQFADH